MPVYPMIPACKDYLWGGHTRLRGGFGVKSTCDPLAEAWVLSCHPDGPFSLEDGRTLPEFLRQAGREALGTHCERFEDFPVLIKLIDAEQNLSIQVHPSDAYALAHEGQYGKTEMWAVLDAEPGAFLYYGFEQPVTREEFARRIKDGTLTEILHRAPAKKGDVFFIPTGTLHAIGAGLIAGVLIVLGLSMYLWPLLALMELRFGQLVKNAALLFLGRLPRSLAALGILAGYLALSVRFFVFAVSLLPFLNLWLPAVPALFLVYPGINEAFRIEKALKENQNSQINPQKQRENL